MDLGNVATGERNDCRLPPVCGVRLDENSGARSLSFGQSIGKIADFVAGHFASVGIRKMSIGSQYDHLAELGVDPHAAIGIAWPADLDARCMAVIGNDFSA